MGSLGRQTRSLTRTPAFRYGAGLGFGVLFALMILQGAGWINARTEAQATSSRGSYELGRGFSSVAKQVSAAVVNINTEQVIQPTERRDDPFSRFFGFDDPFHPFGRQMPRDRRSLGSGFVVDAAGYILTNNHVVERATKIRVGLHDGRTMEKIAVVEDNPDNRELVRVILEGTYSVTEYETGHQAIAGMKKDRPDLVILDISLPLMDGPEVVRHIRLDAELKNLPVIALTAHAMAGDREKYLAAGFNDYVTKPIIDESTLLSTIERWIGHAGLLDATDV